MIGDLVSEACGYAVIDVCEVDDLDYAGLHPDVAGGMRNADPVVFPVLEAIGRLYRVHRSRLDPHANHVGMIQCGRAFPRDTSRRVQQDVERRGRVSPATFINANAGAAISFCCTRFGFRGPTLTLTMPTANARTVVDTLASRWLGNGDARYVLLVTADFTETGEVHATALLAGRPHTN